MKLKQSARQLAEARTKRLMELSQRQVQESRRNLDGTSQRISEPISQKSIGSSDKAPTSGRSLQLQEANVASGMVLPFEPMIMTFRDVHYYVPLPPVSAAPSLGCLFVTLKRSSLLWPCTSLEFESSLNLKQS